MAGKERPILRDIVGMTTPSAPNSVPYSQLRHRYRHCVHARLYGAAASHGHTNGTRLASAFEGPALAAWVTKIPQKRDFPSLPEVGFNSTPRQPSFRHPLATQLFTALSTFVSISYPASPIVYSRVTAPTLSSPPTFSGYCR
ncbi:hypothetical protein P171DRAFT_496366 [Karstenula rhodostoma CBS 690.94]|uniref:Uncharacterized protein n=1 Tax=Karstenula rhodostoma CBS 690.94 TaxID=1392251 RepID=A0A9P4PH25_9PLEO|nr:hypothetical protein P171DRAFT_496366 [Karstenula rhodostoma CBS 690.94]